MQGEFLTGNWALWAAALPVALVVLVTLSALRRESAGGKLNAVLKGHNEANRQLRKGQNAVRKTERRLSRLSAKKDSVKPRVMQEARDAVDDAHALLKILEDRAAVEANHVRRVIYEEFPPARHEAMRARYLPQDVADNRPFSFDT